MPHYSVRTALSALLASSLPIVLHSPEEKCLSLLDPIKAQGRPTGEIEDCAPMAHEGSGWEPPREECVKFNVRGCFDAGRDTRGCGGIARNHNWKIVAHFVYRPPAASSSLTTELLAILRALKVARDLGLKEVEVECDCTEAVKATREGVDRDHPDVDVVNGIMNRLKSGGWKVEVKECNRDQNKAADALAQYASFMVADLYIIWESGVNNMPSLHQGDELQQYYDGDLLAGLPPAPGPSSSGEQSGWKPPRVGRVKFNVRGCFDARGDIRGCGGIARNHNGEMVARFVYRPPAAGSILTTELRAILWALKVAEDLGLKEVEVECDCTEAVRATMEDVDGDHPDADVVDDIMNRWWMRVDWVVEVKECKRDQNTAAEALAQYASSMVTDLLVIHERPPHPLRDVERIRKTNLYIAICGGKWNDVYQILRENPSLLTAEIIAPGLTPLHVAARTGQCTIVDELLNLMSPRLVKRRSSNGYTALALACWYSGETNIVVSLVKKNSDMVRIPNNDDELPVVLAFDTDRKGIGRYLFPLTPLNCLGGRRGSKLLRALIQVQCFDLALDLLAKRKELLLEPYDDQRRTPIHEIATLNTAILSPSELCLWKEHSRIRLKLAKRRGNTRMPMAQGMTVHVSGAYSDEDHTAGCGGIIEDHRGNLIEVFMLTIPKGDREMAQLWASLIGLKRARDRNPGQVCFRNDSQDAKGLIENGNSSHDHWNLIKESRDMIHRLGRDWEVKLEHIPERENSEAIMLAKRALTMSPGFHLTPLQEFASTTATTRIVEDTEDEDTSQARDCNNCICLRMPKDGSQGTRPGSQRVKNLKGRELLNAQIDKLLEVVCNNARSAHQKGVIRKPLGLAAKEGNAEFVFRVSREIREILTGETLLSCFSEALKYRQARVFNLIHGLSFRHGLVTSKTDDNGNTFLHVAAKIADDHVLNRVAAPTLQMQNEFRWFKEVESLTPPSVRELRNKDGKTAKEIFMDSHKVLMKQGEDWIKNTAASCSFVGTLIVTIMFTAAYTIPGGNNSEGNPEFLHQPYFKVFIFSTILSLFFSLASVLTFLKILISQCSADSFLKVLPNMLLSGLSCLFLSILTMVIAFVSTIHLMLRHSNFPWGIIPTVILAILLAVYTAILYSSTFGRTIFSTVGNIFDRNVRPWP